MIDEERLSEIIPENVSLRLVEPHIYSLHSAGENTSSYDRIFGVIYDLVACNRTTIVLYGDTGPLIILPFASMLSNHQRMDGY